MSHFTRPRRYSRRQFIKRAGMSAALLPLLQHTSAHAEMTRIPRRFIALSVPNGYTNDYLPNEVGRAWSLANAEGMISADKPLKSLLPFQDKLLILRGLTIQNGRDSFREARRREGIPEDELGQIGGHATLPFLLTGARGVPGPKIHDNVELSSGHASLDQHLAAHLPGYADLAYPSLVLRPLRLQGNDQYLSFSGPCLDGVTPNAPPPRDNPVQLYDTLFASALTDAQSLAALRARRGSVLDLVSGQLNRFKGRIASEDRIRVEHHLEGVRTIERQLETIQGACVPPQPTAWDSEVDYTRQFGNEHVPLIIKSQIDMLVGAMACDLTRIGTLSLSNSHNNQYIFPWLADRDPGFGQGIDFNSGEDTAGGGSDGLRHHHSIAHATNIGPAQKRRKNFVDQWFIEQFSYLVERLSQTLDVDGTPMIDNTLVLFMNMQRTGGGHQTDDLTWLLAGNAAGFFDTGRYVHLQDSQPTTRLLTSIAHAMGSQEEYFATDEYGGALSELHA